MARVYFRQHNEPLTARGRAFDKEARALAAQLILGTELARSGRFRFQLSVGVSIDPDTDESRAAERDGLDFYVPTLFGVAWD